jgi:hypothetical protein
MSKEFKLWLESEEVDLGSLDIHNGVCFISVELPDARYYNINVGLLNIYRLQ